MKLFMVDFELIQPNLLSISSLLTVSSHCLALNPKLPNTPASLSNAIVKQSQSLIPIPEE